MGRVWESPPRSIQSLAHDVPLPPAPPNGHLVYPLPSQNLLTLSGYRVTDGYVALLPMQRVNPESPLSLQLAQVDWVWTGNSWKPFPYSVPRARLVGLAVLEDTPLLDTSSINFARAALVDPAVQLGGTVSGEATVTTDRPGWIEVSTRRRPGNC